MAEFRRALRAHSWIPLVAFLWGSMLPFSEAHPLGQDDACVVSPAGGDATTHTLTSAATDQGERTHCVICHLMRAMSGVVQPDQAMLPVPFGASARSALLDDSAPTVSVSSPSSRGPPAIL